MKIKMTNKGLDISIKDDQDRCRSLVCDPNGIIVAEMVYRCMICFYVSDSMPEARQHYVQKHIEEDDLGAENAEQIDLDENIPKHLSKKLQNNNTNKYQNGNRNSSSSLNENNGCLDFSSNNSSKYRSSPTEPIDMSPSSDSFDNYLPHVTPDGLDSSTNGNPLSNNSKSGYVNCAVCGVTRFYSCVQRRYGQFTCVTCYRFFKAFFEKPERYSCPNLGKCTLNVRTRCRACWIKACIDQFQVDQEKQQLISAFAPIKHDGGLGVPATLSSLNSEEDDEHEPVDALELESSSPIDDKMDHSDDNNNSINNNLNGFGQMNHSKEALSMMLALNNNGTDLPSLLRKSNLDGFGLLTQASNFVNSNGLFGGMNLSDNQNQSNGFGDDDNPLSFLTPKRNHLNGKSLNSNNLNCLNLSTSNLNGGNADKLKNGGGNQDGGKDSNNNKLSSSKVTKGSAGKKVWSCGKCATCVSEDCGKCIYCLDRPKFGGPFVKKQRCIKRRCLMKVKTKVDKKSLLSSNGNLNSSNGDGLVPISMASSMVGPNSNTSTFVF